MHDIYHIYVMLHAFVQVLLMLPQWGFLHAANTREHYRISALYYQVSTRDQPCLLCLCHACACNPNGEEIEEREDHIDS